jgi:hypothetical protein
MRCLGLLSALVLGPLALTTGAGLFAGSLTCLALSACNGTTAATGGRATPEEQNTKDRGGAPEVSARRRRRAL